MTTNTNNTENMMNNSLTTSIHQHFSKMAILKQEKIDKTAGLYAEISIIEKNFNSQIYETEKKINDIKEQYSHFAHELAIRDGKCPCSRWGGDLEPNEVDINEEGIHLTWIQENNYGRDDYDYFSATWEELLAYELEIEPIQEVVITTKQSTLL